MTQLYAEVIGDPIGHSKSPLIHGFWLKALGIDGDYRATHVTPDGLGDYFAARRADPAWRGCNLTIPHKHAALIGTNTDAGGFYAPIADLALAGAPVVVVGAGGAARAVLFALSRVGVGAVTILNRNVLKAAAMLSSFGLKGQALPLGAPLPAASLLVNTSPLGMTGQPPLDLDLSPLPEQAVVYDIVYAPLETPLLAAARERALDTVDGLEMLIGQAALAFELLFGVAPPRERDDELRALLGG